MIYYRHEGAIIQKFKIGFQWWHGPTFYFRTDTGIYVFKISGRKLIK